MIHHPRCGFRVGPGWGAGDQLGPFLQYEVKRCDFLVLVSLDFHVYRSSLLQAQEGSILVSVTKTRKVAGGRGPSIARGIWWNKRCLGDGTLEVATSLQRCGRRMLEMKTHGRDGVAV
jgi:hypothetical protein